MNFFALRYFVVRTAYPLFAQPEGSFNPPDLFLQPIRDKVQIEYYQKRYTIRIINQVENPRFLVGYLLKEHDAYLTQLSEETELFAETEAENWDRLLFFIDTERQIFFGQVKQSIATPDNVKNVLLDMTRPVAEREGYEIKLDFILDRITFWKIIEESEGIYQIAFNLTAPNLFGGSKAANEWLTVLKQRHNMSSVAVDVRNDQAKLTYDHDELESYRDYADSGGGSWTLGVLQNRHKKKYSSEGLFLQKEIELESDEPQTVAGALGNIFRTLLDFVNSLGE